MFSADKDRLKGAIARYEYALHDMKTSPLKTSPNRTSSPNRNNNSYADISYRGSGNNNETIIIALQGEIDRLKEKLNNVISTAEVSLQNALESQEDIKAMFSRQHDKIISENKKLINDNNEFYEMIGNFLLNAISASHGVII